MSSLVIDAFSVALGCLPEDGVPDAKNQRLECLYVLGSEPELSCDENSNETIFSVQSKETGK
jgi:hypothetical protein